MMNERDEEAGAVERRTGETIEKELRRWKGNWVDLWDEEAVAADAVPPAPSAGAQEGAMVWEYFHDQHWYAYGHASTAALDAARRAGERTALLEPWGAMNRESKTYCVDLENMLQTQMQTRTARESTGEPHGLSDTSTLKTPPPPLPPPPPSPPPVEEGPRASLSALPTFLSTPPPLVMPRPVRCVPAHSLGNAEAPRLALARRNVCLQPPAWAPNVDVELELSGAADPAEMLDFSSAVKAVAFAPDGSCVAAGCHDGQIRTVRLNTQERNLAVCMALHPRLGAGGAWRQGCDKAAGAATQASCMMALLDSDVLRYITSLVGPQSLRLGGHVARAELSSGGSALVTAVSFSPDGKQLAAGTLAGRIIFFDYISGQRSNVEMVAGVSHSIMTLAWVSPVTLTSAGRDRVIRIWSTVTGEQVAAPLQGHMGMINALAAHRSSVFSTLLASGSSDCTVRLWDLAFDFDRGTHAPEAGRQQLSICVQAHGRRSETQMCIRTAVRERGEPLRGHYRSIHAVAFSPDGSRLAVASGDCLISIWDTSTKIARTHGDQLKGHLSSVFCLAFSPDATVLASGGDDRMVRLWSMDTLRPLRNLRGHSGGIASLDFHPAGGVIATGSADGSLRLWDHGEVLT